MEDNKRKHIFDIDDYVYVKCVDTIGDEYGLPGVVTGLHKTTNGNILYDIMLDQSVDNKNPIKVLESEIYSYVLAK